MTRLGTIKDFQGVIQPHPYIQNFRRHPKPVPELPPTQPSREIPRTLAKPYALCISHTTPQHPSKTTTKYFSTHHSPFTFHIRKTPLRPCHPSATRIMGSLLSRDRTTSPNDHRFPLDPNRPSTSPGDSRKRGTWTIPKGPVVWTPGLEPGREPGTHPDRVGIVRPDGGREGIDPVPKHYDYSGKYRY